MIVSLTSKVNNGNINDSPFRFIMKPENNAVAITGEKPDQVRSDPKKYLHDAVKSTSIKIKNVVFVLLCIKIVELILPKTDKAIKTLYN